MKNTKPSNLDEAIQLIIDKIASDQRSIDFIEKCKTENDFTSTLHMWFGRTIRNDWNLWWYENHNISVWPKEKPLIVKFFNEKEIYHADDISSIILTSAYRKYYNNPIELENQIKKYHRFWLETSGNINPLKNN